MASVKIAEQDPSTILHWFTGKVVRFKTRQGDYFVHENLLYAKCATTGINFVNTIRREQPFQNVYGDEMAGFSHFLLWVNCDSMGPIANNPEKSYLDAFCLAHRYGLPEFEEFVSSKFAEFAPAYYGGGREGDIHNPTLINVAYAHEQLGNNPARRFIIEQFARSWIYRHAYSKKELDWLVDKHPELAKSLFQIFQDVVIQSQKKSLATFDWCAPEMNEDAADSDKATDASDDRGERLTGEESDLSGGEHHDDCSCQQPSDDQHMSSNEEFEVVSDERPCDAPASEAPYPEEQAKCESPVPDENVLPECYLPVPEADPVEKTEPVEEEENIWGSGVRPKKKITNSAWGWCAPEPNFEEEKEEAAEFAMEDAKQPIVEDVPEPRRDVAEETFQRPEGAVWRSFGTGPMKKKLKGRNKGKNVTDRVKGEV